MKLTLIAAMARNRVIGHDNRLPWHLPEDLRHFRALTIGKPLLMGRRTWESIGRALPGRTSIVLSTKPMPALPGVLGASDLGAALELARRLAPEDAAAECMVIGGAQVYRLTLPCARRIHLTQIEADIEGDTYFPALEPREWGQTACVEGVGETEPHWRFRFLTFERLEG